MGEFRIGFECDGRRSGIRVPNALMYRAHDLILAGTHRDCALGISGPMFTDEDDAPFPLGDPLSIGPRNTLADYEGGNDGGLTASDTRAMEAYQRQAITWTISRDGRATLMDSGSKTFTSRIAW